MKRWARRGAAGFTAVSGVAVVAWIWFEVNAATLVGERLTAELRMPAHVGSVSAGWTSSVVKQLRIAEHGSTGDAIWFAAPRIETDLGLPRALANQRPTRLRALAPEIVLRFAADHQLLTRFPPPPYEAVPTTVIESGVLVLRVAGQPDRAFRGLNGTARTEGRRVCFDGTLADPDWSGPWAVAARWDMDTNAVRLELHSPGTFLPMALLENLPFVPASVWRHVRVEGHSPVHLIIQSDSGGTNYRVGLRPTRTKVHVGVIQLDADAASGEVVIEDNVVTLRDVRGTVADGELRVPAAELDFRKSDPRLRFDFAAARLDVRQFPASWEVPRGLSGRLSGTATLAVNFYAGVGVPTGRGDGRVESARIGLLPVPDYGLVLQFDSRGFRFVPRFVR